LIPPSFGETPLFTPLYSTIIPKVLILWFFLKNFQSITLNLLLSSLWRKMEQFSQGSRIFGKKNPAQGWKAAKLALFRS
jgi:hypothetical protein